MIREKKRQWPVSFTEFTKMLIDLLKFNNFSNISVQFHDLLSNKYKTVDSPVDT